MEHDFWRARIRGPALNHGSMHKLLCCCRTSSLQCCCLSPTHRSGSCTYGCVPMTLKALLTSLVMMTSAIFVVMFEDLTFKALEPQLDQSNSEMCLPYFLGFTLFHSPISILCQFLTALDPVSNFKIIIFNVSLSKILSSHIPSLFNPGQNYNILPSLATVDSTAFPQACTLKISQYFYKS